MWLLRFKSSFWHSKKRNCTWTHRIPCISDMQRRRLVTRTFQNIFVQNEKIQTQWVKQGAPFLIGSFFWLWVLGSGPNQYKDGYIKKNCGGTWKCEKRDSVVQQWREKYSSCGIYYYKILFNCTMLIIIKYLFI